MTADNSIPDVFGTMNKEPSFIDKCRQMEKDVEEQLLVINLMQTDNVYLGKMVEVLQALHNINKNH